MRQAARLWAEQSARDQGLPPFVRDGAVLGQVAGLLGVSPRPKAAGTPSALPGLGSPDRIEAAGIETVEARSSRANDDVIEDSGNDGVLPSQGQLSPAVSQDTGVADVPGKRRRAA